jgi:flagella basal body P-ring formation protein FlgA
MQRGLLILVGLAVAAAASSDAAEIQFRGKCQPKETVAMLGDVADIRSSDAAEAKMLAAIELFPTPAAGQQRVVRSEEIEKLLSYRPVNLARHRFSGAVEVVVCGPDGSGESLAAKPVSASTARKAENAVRSAIVAYLKKTVGDEQPWNVELQLTNVQARMVPAEGRRMAVAGGQSPYTGRQTFDVIVENGTRSERFAVEATVAAQDQVVVAAVAIPRGALIRESDVALVSHVANARPGAARSLDLVVGREATRAIAKDTVVQTQAVSQPLLVHGRDIVTVYSRCGGVTVRTTARARQDGSQGDLIAVESLADRRAAFSARVCGVQEVEVYASPMKSGNATTDSLSIERTQTPSRRER